MMNILIVDDHSIVREGQVYVAVFNKLIQKQMYMRQVRLKMH